MKECLKLFQPISINRMLSLNTEFVLTSSQVSYFITLSIGHIKLTDFGLSKVEIDRDLQIKDFCSKTPLRLDVKQKTSIAGLRTPGQILSLTSHLSFASNSKSSNDFTQQESINSVSTMSDGNITHQHSPKKLNISLGVSPEKQRVRQLSNVSSNRYIFKC